MYPNILYNAVTAAGFILPVLATEGIKSICGAFGIIIKGKVALLTFMLVWVVMNSSVFAWRALPPNAGPAFGNNFWYVVQSFFQFLAGIGIYNFVRRFINAIEGTRIQAAIKK